MPFTDASRSRLLIRPETVYGETPPANAATTRLRFVSETFGQRNTTALSEEIRPDRQRTDMMLVGVDAEGDVNMEMSEGAEFDMLLEAVLGGTWTANVLRNGVINRSFNVEKGFLDIAKYMSMPGSVVGRMSLNVTARAIVQATVGFMGNRVIAAGASIAGTTTPTEPSANPPMKAGSSIVLLDSGTTNEELFGVTARSLTLEINNNLRTREQVTSQFGAEPGRGVMEITGTLETYFQDIAIYNAFLANSFFALKFQIADTSRITANSYKFTLPALKVSDAPATIPGNSADVMQTIAFRGLLDAAVGYAIDVTRQVAFP